MPLARLALPPGRRPPGDPVEDPALLDHLYLLLLLLQLISPSPGTSFSTSEILKSHIFLISYKMAFDLKPVLELLAEVQDRALATYCHEVVAVHQHAQPAVWGAKCAWIKPTGLEVVGLHEVFTSRWKFAATSRVP